MAVIKRLLAFVIPFVVLINILASPSGDGSFIGFRQFSEYFSSFPGFATFKAEIAWISNTFGGSFTPRFKDYLHLFFELLILIIDLIIDFANMIVWVSSLLGRYSFGIN